MRKIHVFLGRFIYTIFLPLRRAYRSDKTRAYGLLEHNGKVLIVKNWLGSGNWSLPGGGGHDGETYEDTLIREIHEETGLNLDKKQAKLILKGEHNREFGKKKFVVFSISLSEKPTIFINKLEIVDYMWVNKEDIHTLHPVSYEIKQVAGKF